MDKESSLDKLYINRLNEENFTAKSTSYVEARDKWIELHRAFVEKVKDMPEIMEAYDKLEFASVCVSSESERLFFADGFRCAVRMMSDVYFPSFD